MAPDNGHVISFKLDKLFMLLVPAVIFPSEPDSGPELSFDLVEFCYWYDRSAAS
jgi:hypothetical protein